MEYIHIKKKTTRYKTKAVEKITTWRIGIKMCPGNTKMAAQDDANAGFPKAGQQQPKKLVCCKKVG